MPGPKWKCVRRGGGRGGGSSREEKQHKVKKGREAEGRGVTGESEREATDTSRR